jgi:hypothetical protein
MSVIRIKHTKDYVCIHKGALEDPRLSFKAKGLWAYCMSKPNDWEFHVNHLATVCKDKRTVIYSSIKELIKAGYCTRVCIREKGKVTGIQYTIYEIPNLKISLPLSGNLNSEKLNSENRPLISNDSYLLSNESQSNSSKVETKSSAKAEPSADADHLCEFFIESIKKRCPDLKPPNLVKWRSCMDLLLRVDKRDLEKTKRLISWAESHKYWKSACLSPEKLRKAYDEMSIQMDSEASNRIIQINRTYALQLKEKYPEELKAFTFDDKYAINRSLGKEISFSMEPEAFKAAFISLFGGERGRR